MIDINLNELAALPEDIKRVREEAKQTRKSTLERLRKAQKERIALAKKLRKAAETLLKAGFKLQRSEYHTGLPYEYMYLDLGEVTDEPSRERINRDKLMIAKMFKCHLEEDGKELVDGKKKKVKVSLSISKVPNIWIRYVDVLQDGGKCRVEKQTVKTKRRTEYRLVCDV